MFLGFFGNLLEIVVSIASFYNTWNDIKLIKEFKANVSWNYI